MKKTSKKLLNTWSKWSIKKCLLPKIKGGTNEAIIIIEVLDG